MTGGRSGCFGFPSSLVSSHKCFGESFAVSFLSLDTTLNWGSGGVFSSAVGDFDGEEQVDVGLGDLLLRVITSSSPAGSEGGEGMLLGDVENICPVMQFELSSSNWFKFRRSVM